jgi:hypothetical protein
MGMANELELIATRRSQIAGIRSQHVDALKALDAELDELDIAERVISRLSSSTPPISAAVLAGAEAAAGTRKPPNIPTIPEMISDILKIDISTDTMTIAPAMTPKQLTEQIRARWWPNVTPSEISPIAWRMAQRGELVKDGPLYRRPDPLGEKSTPPDGNAPPEDEG